LEKCSACGKEYLRDFECEARYRNVDDHRTYRYCAVPLCGGMLTDTIINFGENLPKATFDRGWANCEQCDLMVVLGSSLTVTPACKMPLLVAKNGKKMVIVNLQKTDFDDQCAMRVYAKCDNFIKLVMEELAVEVPPFILHRRVSVQQKTPKSGNKHIISICGVDVDGIPATFIEGVIVTMIGTANANKELEVDSDRPKVEFKIPKDTNGNTVEVKLFFFGNYNEPPQSLQIPIVRPRGEVTFNLFYSPLSGSWKINDPIVTITKKEGAE